MNKSLSSSTPGMLSNIPYAHLIKYEEKNNTYVVFYAVDVAENFVATATPYTISGQGVYVNINISYQEGAKGGLFAGSTNLPTFNERKQPILNVEVSGMIFPPIHTDQPQRSGTTTIIYQDAD